MQSVWYLGILPTVFMAQQIDFPVCVVTNTECGGSLMNQRVSNHRSALRELCLHSAGEFVLKIVLFVRDVQTSLHVVYHKGYMMVLVAGW